MDLRLPSTLLAIALCAAVHAGHAQTAAPPAAPLAEPTDRVVVSGQSQRERDYELFTALEGTGICPTGGETPRGFSCAQVTYEVYTSDGEFLRRCNLPIFGLIDGVSVIPTSEDNMDDPEADLPQPEMRGYFAQSFDRMTCGKNRKSDVELIPIQQIIKPRTSDGTTFRIASIMGYRQAQDICKASEAHCAIDLFDHRKSLSREALNSVWPSFGAETAATRLANALQ